jgi:2-dehydropantoate 2-reductase
MRITVVGAGSVGGLMAYRLAVAGHAVSVIARGDHLAAIQNEGLRVIEGPDAVLEGTANASVAMHASDNPAVIAQSSGAQDLMIISLKAHSIPAMLPRLKPLLHPQTRVVAAINGVPWWYLSDANNGRYLKTLDPDGTASNALDSSRLVGCVVHLSAEVAAPGVVRHTGGNRLILGEVRETQPTSSLSAVGLVELFNAAGFAAEYSGDIRTDIWTKLIGNLSFNPVSALTGLRMDRLCADPAICDLLRALIEEGKAVAAAIGIPLTIDAGARIAMARALGPVRTSTLQDFDAGRRPELDALVGAVIELAQWHQVPVPALRHVYALTQGRAHALGLLSA